ncbi:hypothetical protein Dda_6810 [Drechslerella dactyloides]|uniref:Uncharacterized protein n=1 Tax=Drechslerella dactyloides TaxID=74499 RepID=A0AAD6NHV6_DREDA|nr:hypothetical protein Dda_6810 [Drechslerella dactyloides]
MMAGHPHWQQYARRFRPPWRMPAYPPGPPPWLNQGPEFQLEPADPGGDAPNREKIMIEQQRILGIFNDFMTAQKLKALGQTEPRVPQLANEALNRTQLQQFIRDLAENNVNKATLSGLVNNFSTQYHRLAVADSFRPTDAKNLDAAEMQKQLNEIEKARVLGYHLLPLQLRRHLRICQAAVVLAIGCVFGSMMAIWSGARALNANMHACRTAGLQLIIVGLMAVLVLCSRILSRVKIMELQICSGAFGHDRFYVSRAWDGLAAIMLAGIIAFGAWFWARSVQLYGPNARVAAAPDATDAAASTAGATYVTKTVMAMATEGAANMLPKGMVFAEPGQ